jgi:hypothetical protein
MARDLLRVWMKLDNIRCYDEGDGWGDAEPYLWTVFFKIDGARPSDLKPIVGDDLGGVGKRTNTP